MRQLDRNPRVIGRVARRHRVHVEWRVCIALPLPNRIRVWRIERVQQAIELRVDHAVSLGDLATSGILKPGTLRDRNAQVPLESGESSAVAGDFDAIWLYVALYEQVEDELERWFHLTKQSLVVGEQLTSRLRDVQCVWNGAPQLTKHVLLPLRVALVVVCLQRGAVLDLLLRIITVSKIGSTMKSV